MTGKDMKDFTIVYENITEIEKALDSGGSYYGSDSCVRIRCNKCALHGHGNCFHMDIEHQLIWCYMLDISSED